TFSSCEKSDSSDEPVKKLVKVVSEYDDGGRVVREISYDDEGRVASVSVNMADKYETSVANLTYEYSENEIIMTREKSNEESVVTEKYILGASSLPIKSIYTRGKGNEEDVKAEIDFVYDPNGYLVDYDGFVNITWKDGNMIKLDYGFEGYAVIDYTDSTHTEPLISKFTNYDFDNWLYFAENVTPFKLKLSGNLPIHFKYQSASPYECSYSWKFDADGYPTEVRKTVVGEEVLGVKSATYYFNWE
ncbi:MAG: DUF4595 domain-containing protein, partial [Paludibacteraceae bacterium]|nr:DUF4595 domain-containing protein [Paludibacteraceae bacterium]